MTSPLSTPLKISAAASTLNAEGKYRLLRLLLFPSTFNGALSDVAPVTERRSIVPTFCKFVVVNAPLAAPDTTIDLLVPVAIKFFVAATASKLGFSFNVLTELALNEPAIVSA